MSIPSLTITSVRPPARSMSSTSPLIGNIITCSGRLIEYHTHRLSRFWATTTLLPGTHCTYEQ